MDRGFAIFSDLLSVAAVDGPIVDAFDALAGGPLKSLDQLRDAERFIRAVILHDQTYLYVEPFLSPTKMGYDPITLPDGRFQTGQWIRGNSDYLRLVQGPYTGPIDPAAPRFTLPSSLLADTARLVGAGPGDENYEQNLHFLQSLMLTAKRGGSVVCGSPVGTLAQSSASRYPEALFSTLDTEYQQFAREAHRGFDITIPPLTAVILNRAKSREGLIDSILELRDEWTKPREQLWLTLNQLRAARNPAESAEMVKALQEAAKGFSPSSPGRGSLLVEVLWEVVDKSAGGAVEAWIAAGHPLIGSVAKGTTTALRSIGTLGRRLFARGAFSLGRTVRRELTLIEPTRELLSPLLTASERSSLGL